MLLVRKIGFLLCFVFLFSGLIAQQSLWCDASSFALSGADAGYTQSTVVSNPAVLASNQASYLGLNYLNRYGLPDLGSSSLSGVFYTPHGSCYASLNYFGTVQYNEIMISLGYGQVLFDWLHAGIKLNYHQQSIEALNQSIPAISGEIGLLACLTDEVYIGLHFINPTGSNYAGSIDGPDTEIRLGLCYLKEKNFYACIQLSLTDYNRPQLSFGFEYCMIRQIVFRTGIQIDTDLTYSFGLGISHNKNDLSIGFEQHSLLGTAAAIMFRYTIWKE